MNIIELSDSALVSLYIAGNENAFELLVNRHKNKVFTTVLLIVKDTETAEDLLQDTFIKAIHTMKSGRYNEEGKFSSWICRIAHNLAIDFFRKEKRSPMINIDDNSNIFNTLSFSEESIESIQIKEETH
jgi:RNA polymerase sigma-70 factor (ECF subfamily)